MAILLPIVISSSDRQTLVPDQRIDARSGFKCKPEGGHESERATPPPASSQEHGKSEGGHQNERTTTPPSEHSTPPHANGGRVPPPPQAHKDSRGEREVERDEGGRVNDRQHVNHDHWYGHDNPNDARFHVEHPFEHGRFEHPGASFRHNVVRVDASHHRFWFSQGAFFEVASWDWAECEDWCWNCGDQFVIYDDPDHIGWYLLYNVETGVYVHVLYLGG